MASPSTIFALASGALPSAIAVVRISGSRSGACLRNLTKGRKNEVEFPPRKLVYTSLWSARVAEGRKGGDAPLDYACVVWMPAPHTYTGEESAELYLHGSKAVVSAVSRELASFEGVRHARPGEFTRRALLNGKIDLEAATAVRRLIDARTERQRVAALTSMKLARSESEEKQRDSPPERKALESLRDAIIGAHLLIDFGEHVESASIEKVVGACANARRWLLEALRVARACRTVHDGIKIAVVGPPNVGKSSLVNQLTARDASIVSDVAGTTRDAVQVDGWQLDGVPLSIVDTAGLRAETSDQIEVEGMRRAAKRASEADVLLIVVDASRNDVERQFYETMSQLSPSDAEDRRQKRVIILNKRDRVAARRVSGTNLPFPTISTCALSPEGCQDLVAQLRSAVSAAVDTDWSDRPGTAEFRIDAIERALQKLDECTEDYAQDAGVMAEVLAEIVEDLEATMPEGAQLAHNPTLLDRIFKEFCIGK